MSQDKTQTQTQTAELATLNLLQNLLWVPFKDISVGVSYISDVLV